jgi:uncharacterized membrane protein
MKNNTIKKRNEFRRALRNISKEMYKRRYIFAVAGLFLIILFLFFGFFKMLFFFIILSLMNISFSYLTKTIPRYGTSFELIMMCTVLAGVAYGPKAGGIFGMISCILYYYGAGRFSYFVTITAPLYGIVGIAASLFSGLPLIQIGLWSAIIYGIISSVLVILIYGAHLDRALIFLTLNISFNFIIFKYAAPLLLRLMVL